MKYEDLDGCQLIKDKEFDRLKDDFIVRKIKQKIEDLAKCRNRLKNAVDPDWKIHFEEEIKCLDLVSHHMGIEFGEKKFNELELDKVYGMNYSDVRVHCGLSAYPNILKYRDQDEEDLNECLSDEEDDIIG